MNYILHTSLAEDEHEGRIWIKDQHLESAIKNRRQIIKISLTQHNIKKTVYVEALYADPFYLLRWKDKNPHVLDEEDSSIFLSGWYRKRLSIQGIRLPKKLNFDVSLVNSSNPIVLLYQYPRAHPQILILIANMLGVIGTGLGITGTGLGVLSVKDLLNLPYFTGICAISGIILIFFGLLITISGFIGLMRK